MQIEKWMSFSWMKFGLSGVFARNDSERFKNYSLFSNVFRDVSGLNRSFLVRSAEVSQYFFEILFWTETFRTHLALLKKARGFWSTVGQAGILPAGSRLAGWKPVPCHIWATDAPKQTRRPTAAGGRVD
jgi:hypothetical protein